MGGPGREVAGGGVWRGFPECRGFREGVGDAGDVLNAGRRSESARGW